MANPYLSPYTTPQAPVPGRNGPIPPGWTVNPPGDPGYVTPTVNQPGSTGPTPDPSTTVNYGTGPKGANDAMLAYLNSVGNNFSSIPSEVDKLNAQYGLGSGSGLAWYPGKNVVAASGGGYYAIGPDGKWGYNVGDSQGGPAAGGPTGGAYTPGQGVPGQGTVFGPNNPLTGQTNALEAQLLAELGPNSTNPAFSIDPNNPVLQNRVDAFGVQQQQGERNTLSQLAEKSGPNANLDAATRSLGEAAGQATSGFKATLMGQQLQARQSEIQAVLAQYGNMLTAEQQMQLNEELAQLNLAQQAYQNGQTNQYNNNALTLAYGG
jgi:hypothetical protein